MSLLSDWAEGARTRLPALLTCGVFYANRRVSSHALQAVTWTDLDAPWKILGETAQVVRMHRLGLSRFEFKIEDYWVFALDLDEVVVGLVLETAPSQQQIVWDLLEQLGSTCRQESKL